MRRVIPVLLFVVLLGGVGYYFRIHSKVPVIVANPPSEALSEEAYSAKRTELISILDTKDPRAALTALREEGKTNDALMRSCHDLAHELGHEAYEKYGTFGKAMQYQDDLCNAGYLHGIIESHFASSTDILATLQTTCSGFTEGRFESWECYHGIGHGLMYFTENDLPKSVTYCDTLKTSFEKNACANGIFMENFNTDNDTGHSTEYVKDDDLFYPCGIEGKMHTEDCYFYAPTHYLTLHKNDYDGAMKWCEGAPSAYRSVCAAGVGSQTIKENINNPKIAESVCVKGTSGERRSCIQGMTGLYIFHSGSLAAGEQLCSIVEKENKSDCEAAVRNAKPLFQ